MDEKDIMDFIKDNIEAEEDLAKKAEAFGILVHTSSLIKGKRPSSVNIQYENSIEGGSQVVMTITYRIEPSRSELKAMIIDPQPSS